MKDNQAKKKLERGETIYGIFANACSPDLVEMMGIAGFDFIVVDSEHSSTNEMNNRILNMAGEAQGVSMFTRIPNKLDSTVLRSLDAGAKGLLVPQVNSREEAESVCRAARYYPEGLRGVTLPRNADYGVGIDLGNYFKHCNENLLMAVQCENILGVPHLEEIAQVPGVDVIFIGPFDLSQSMGIPGQTQSPQVMEVVQKVLEVTKKNNKYPGIFVGNAAQAKYYADMGFKYIIVATDLMLFGSACKQVTSELGL